MQYKFKNSTLVIALAVSVALLLLLTACNNKDNITGTDTTPSEQQTDNETQEKEEPVRSLKPTNDFNQLIARTESIQSMQYNLSDSGLDEKNYFYLYKRLMKVQLPEPREHETGQVYDEIYMDRPLKKALSHCSKTLCKNPTDKELEAVDYDEFNQLTPLEQMYKSAKPTFEADEMYNDNEVKRFSMFYNNKYPGNIWIQSYYGFPMKLEYTLDDGTKREIVYENIKINNVQLGRVLGPFNFTVEGETYFTFLHYLGIYPGQPGASNMMPV
jgi:hypothetical protein